MKLFNLHINQTISRIRSQCQIVGRLLVMQFYFLNYTNNYIALCLIVYKINIIRDLNKEIKYAYLFV